MHHGGGGNGGQRNESGLRRDQRSRAYTSKFISNIVAIIFVSNIPDRVYT
jgi:hypothetical protein